MIDHPINPQMHGGIDLSNINLDEPSAQQSQPQRVNEQQNTLPSSSMGLSENLVRLVVRDEFQKLMESIKQPRISENDIQKTFVKMLKEGKISISKK